MFYVPAMTCMRLLSTIFTQASPFVLQISGTKEDAVSVAVLPTE